MLAVHHGIGALGLCVADLESSGLGAGRLVGSALGSLGLPPHNQRAFPWIVIEVGQI